MRAVKGSLALSPKEKYKESEALARATGTPRVSVGWRMKKLRAVREQTSSPSKGGEDALDVLRD
jgi:hypothetical protein